MKNKTIIAVAFLGLAIAFTSCKKEYVTINGTQEKPVTADNYNHTDNYIITHKWRITPLFGNAGNTLIWKLNVEGTNNYLIIDPVDNSIYYRDEYKTPGSYIDGALVIKLSIKKP